MNSIDCFGRISPVTAVSICRVLIKINGASSLASVMAMLHAYDGHTIRRDSTVGEQLTDSEGEGNRSGGKRQYLRSLSQLSAPFYLSSQIIGCLSKA